MTSENTTAATDDLKEIKSLSIIFDLLAILKNFIYYLPLVFLILGFIGFVGNIITYLQPEFRSNTFCIYSLCGSIVDMIHLSLNALPDYLSAKYGIKIPWETSSDSCRLLFFLYVYLPNLSINFLVMSMIDRFACTCSFTSKLHRLNQLKNVPWTISLTIIISCLSSIYAPIMTYRGWTLTCIFTNERLFGIFNLFMNGFMPPVVMLIFVFLTYRNVRLTHRRISAVSQINSSRLRNQFLVMVIIQVFVTAFISLQWMIVMFYILITASYERSLEQEMIIIFVLTLSGYYYYLNNVKSFYLSLVTSRRFRKNFIKALNRLSPRKLCSF